jgi:hypothetical protein
VRAAGSAHRPGMRSFVLAFFFLVACGGSVADSSSPAPATNPGPSEQPVAEPPPPLDPPSCAGSALVVASLGSSVVAATHAGDRWSPAQTLSADRTSTVGAFVDRAGALGAVWAADDGTIRTTTSELAASARAIVAAGVGTIVFTAESGVSVAAFENGSWSTFAPLADLRGPVGARGELAGELVVAGRADDRTLLTAVFSDASWSPPESHAGTRVFHDAEIITSGPSVVRYADGDVGVFYLESSIALATVTRHGSAWSAPARVAIEGTVTFVAEAAKDEAIAVVRSVAGAVVALPYTRASGFGAPIAIDTSPASDLQTLAIAPGICGEDVVVAYAGGDGTYVARVSAGHAASTERVMAGAPVSAVALATHR